MKSYWLVRYSFFFDDKEKGLIEIKGNSVHELPGETFLPGGVVKTIKSSLSKEIEHKRLAGSLIEVIIESFGEIDERGFNDFQNPDDISGYRFSLNGREFSQKSTVTILS